jgi:acyl carrier protein
MDQRQIVEQILMCVRPYARNKEAFDAFMETLRAGNVDFQALATKPGASFMEEMGINSARRIDILLDIESKFNIQIEDELVDQMTSMEASIAIVQKKLEEKAGAS